MFRLLHRVQHHSEEYNSLTIFLFNLLESHSLFAASEYLALKLMNQNSCLVEEGIANQLESYRKMKVGNTAPDIEFSADAIKIGIRLRVLKASQKFNLRLNWCFSAQVGVQCVWRK